MRVRVRAGRVVMEAALASNAAARALWDALPLTAPARRAQDELSFEVPLALEVEDAAHELQNPGDLEYRPTSRAVSIYFGFAPSDADPDGVTIGRLLGDPREFRGVRARTAVTVERVEG